MLESPIALTNTLNVGLVADALVQYSIQQTPEIGITAGSVNVLVGETNDMTLNDIQGRHVKAEHVFAALESASSGSVAEGVVGAGCGTTCFGWKGGIGTSSRRLPPELGGYTIGALVQSNYGDCEDFTVCGVPVGRTIRPPKKQSPSLKPADGSIMMVLATDAPLDSNQLLRFCKRAAIGLARTGSIFGNSSGDFVIGFSTAHRIPEPITSQTAQFNFLQTDSKMMNSIFHAVAESIEEAILNSVFMAHTVVGQGGNTRYQIPVEEICALVKAANQIP